MSEQQKEQNTAPESENDKVDTTAASTALAQAVTSAEKSGAKPAEPKASADKASAEKAPADKTAAHAAPETKPFSRPAWQNHAAKAAAVAVAIGLAWAGGSLALAGKRPAQVAPEWAEAARSMHQNKEDLLRLTGDVRVLKGIIETMKEGIEQGRLETAGQQHSLAERIGEIERSSRDLALKMAHVAEASERLERASADTGLKLAGLSGRFDSIERPPEAPTVTPAAKQTVAATADAAPQQTGTVPDAKPAPKAMPLEGWVLRDVQRGIALVESRNGRLHEVAAGQTLPTLGRVEAIERRGRSWVVVTSKGIIAPESRWQ